MNKKQYDECHIGFHEDATVQKELLLKAIGFPEEQYSNYVIHHRDDTAEAIDFNNKHYERFGLSLEWPYVLDFRYIQIMTRSEHSKYHMNKES